MEPIFRNLLLFLFCTALSCYSQKKIIPFTINKEGRIVLSYEMNGKKINVVYDTGSFGHLIDFNMAKELEIHPKNNQLLRVYTLSNNPIDLTLTERTFGDSIFYPPWFLTDMEKTSKSVGLGENIDGLFGIDFNDRFVVEIDFIKQQLCFWESIPSDYLNGRRVKTAELINSDHGFENPLIKHLPPVFTIRGSIVVVDTLVYQTNYILDTGCADYLTLSVKDSVLMKKMISFKKMMSEIKGTNYPTTHLYLPELNIDSLYINVPVVPKCYEYEDNQIPIFGDAVMGGFLGVRFLRQYDRVLFDIKNKIVYFVKDKKFKLI